MLAVSMGGAASRSSLAAFDSELGWMALAWRNRVLARLSFGHATQMAAIRGLGLPDADCRAETWPQLAERLRAYAAGEPDDFADIAVDFAHLTPFERRVIEQCRRIPFGQTLSYGRLAALAGSPGAARAVGNAMAGNRCPLVIPCHRVVHASGAIGHYSAPAGRRMKLRLLEQEGAWQGGKLRSPAALTAR